MPIFAFGRDHEKRCAARDVPNRAELPLVLAMIDAVHDRIEGKGAADTVRQTLRRAFVEGGSGVWENAAPWLRKCTADDPDMLQLWNEFADHPAAAVRFRAACYLDQLPSAQAMALSARLLQDRSKKVRAMAQDQVDRRLNTEGKPA